ncbi:MAG: noncanonical pyrimidine nucleotidase, YjjG family [Spirochaetales bacterium]|nr:noncanonical pyrimidine nucleotidase, YjjG family [Spirochaetales bacterium]
MYRHLFLDLDGTLMDFREAERRAFTLMAGQLEIPIDEDSHLLFARGNRACWKEHEEGRLSIEELSLKRFILFGESGGLSFDPESASSVYEDHLGRQAILYPETLPLLTLLKDEGYRLHIASNGIGRVQRGRLEASNLGRFFDHLFISTEIGVSKPRPGFFEHMLRTTGAKMRECVMIGDSLSSDIQGALDVHMDCIWINAEHQETSLEPTYTITSLSELHPLLDSLKKE